MKINWIVSALVTVTIIGGGAYFYKNRQQATELPFKTEQPQKRTIKQTVSTSGFLELKDIMKVGSFQLGFVKKVCVHENDIVKKDQLLAVIDFSKNSSDVQAAEHRLDRAQKEADYQKAFFKRQEALFASGQLSKDKYQKAQSEYKKAVADVNAAIADLRKYNLEYETTKIKSPDDGIVIGIYATKGLVVSPAIDVSSLTLFEIAQDLTKMQARLDIDESDVGQIKAGQTVKLTLNSFPDLRITGTISQVSFTPKTITGQQAQTSNDQASYKALVAIDNHTMQLRPGMIVNANIKIQKAPDVVSVSGFGFYISREALEKIAPKIGFTVVPLPKGQLHTLAKKDLQKTIKSVWVVQGNQFVQRAVSIGISDTMYWEIKNGLSPSDTIVTDIQEPEEMEALYQKMFKGSL